MEFFPLLVRWKQILTVIPELYSPDNFFLLLLLLSLKMEWCPAKRQSSGKVPKESCFSAYSEFVVKIRSFSSFETLNFFSFLLSSDFINEQIYYMPVTIGSLSPSEQPTCLITLELVTLLDKIKKANAVKWFLSFLSHNFVKCWTILLLKDTLKWAV